MEIINVLQITHTVISIEYSDEACPLNANGKCLISGFYVARDSARENRKFRESTPF